MQSTTPFEQSPSNHLPLNPQLKCGETYLPPDTTFHNNDIDQNDDDDNDTDFYHHVQSYNFHVTLPPPPPITANNDATPTATRPTLEFYSRERSSGTGILHPHHDDEMTTLDTVYDGPMDPHFFERGFYLEAKTGFQVWPGSRLLLDALLCDLPPAVDDAGGCGGGGNGDSLERLRYLQKRLRPTTATTATTTAVQPLHILEVGSGIGVVGTTLAAAGGHVLMTDLPVLVHHGIRPNLLRNRKKTNVSSAQVNHVTTDENDNGNANVNAVSSFLTTLHPIEQDTTMTTKTTHPIPIGRGYARPTVLDWFQPIHTQLASTTVSNVHLIVACDCIFLTKIVDPLLDTVGQIFDCCMERDRADRDGGGEEEDGREGTTTTCLFTYQKRNLSGVFISLEELLRRIETRGWSVRCLAWRKVMVEEDGEHDLYLFEMSSRRGCADDGWGRRDLEEVPCEEKKE